MTGRHDPRRHDMARLPDPEVTPALSVAEAARFLKMGRTRAYELARTGKFPVDVLDTGGALIVPTAALRRFLKLDAPPLQ